MDKSWKFQKCKLSYTLSDPNLKVTCTVAYVTSVPPLTTTHSSLQQLHSPCCAWGPNILIHLSRALWPPGTTTPLIRGPASPAKTGSGPRTGRTGPAEGPRSAPTPTAATVSSFCLCLQRSHHNGLWMARYEPVGLRLRPHSPAAA